MGGVVVWGFAMGITALPVVLAAIAGGTLDNWISVYVAGGIGGLVLEMLLSRWQLELPTANRRQPDPDRGETEEDSEADFAAPLGPRIDLGFLGRFFTGGLAAVTLLILGALAFADKTPDEVIKAGTNLSIAWGIAIGASSPAVWRGLRKIVEARTAAVRRYYVKELSSKDEKLKTAKRGQKTALDGLKRVRAETAKRGRQTKQSGVSHLLAPEAEVGQHIKRALQKDPKTIDDIGAEVAKVLAKFTPAEDAEDVELEDGFGSLDQAIGALEALQQQLDG
jgi:hypothetical protein